MGDPTTELFLLFAGMSILMVAFGLGLWLAERLGEREARTRRPASRHSPVWSFNGMPAGAIVDTEVSFRRSLAKKAA